MAKCNECGKFWGKDVKLRPVQVKVYYTLLDEKKKENHELVKKLRKEGLVVKEGMINSEGWGDTVGYFEVRVPTTLPKSKIAKALGLDPRRVEVEDIRDG
jgi:hypothetical protein